MQKLKFFNCSSKLNLYILLNLILLFSAEGEAVPPNPNEPKKKRTYSQSNEQHSVDAEAETKKRKNDVSSSTHQPERTLNNPPALQRQDTQLDEKTAR